MNVLGISAFYHDSAAALLAGGKIVAAAQEERFTRIKHDPAFPTGAIDYCLEEAGITPGQIDLVVFYEKPILKFDRLLETYLSYAPAGLKSFRMALPLWLKKKLHLKREMNRGLKGKYKGRYVFTEHHESHAASAFFPSPFDQAAILTIDGVGEWATAAFGVGRGNRIALHREIRFPHSLGLLYSAFTYYCGFRVNGGEHKLMGLAPYGEPIYLDRIAGKVIDVSEDGSFHLDMKYFNYCQGLTMTSQAFEDLMGQPPRKPESELDQFYMDVAASIQALTQDVILKLARHVHRETGMEKLCLAGGVALNCVANGLLLRQGPFEDIWIQPAAGDAGCALGAAQFVWHQLLDNPRTHHSDQGPSYLGPAFSQETINAILDSNHAVYELAASEEELCDKVADLIVRQKVAAWFQGRMEFGPRALGARSILGDARSEQMQKTMNLKIKFRESFRPFAPVILRRRVQDYFALPPHKDSPYMLLVAPVSRDKRIALPGDAPGVKGLNKLNLKRSVVPAITHVDYSARVQTTDESRHGLYHKLLETFESKTGSPVLINTSFNVRGEPIVCRPEEAYHCFMGTDIDALVLGQAILKKEDQPQANLTPSGHYATQFALQRSALPVSRFIDVDWKPASRKLRQFALASLLGFPLIGLLLEKLLPLTGIAAVTALAASANFILVGAATGALVCLLGLILPKIILPVYVALVALVLPIGLALSFLLIPLIYYGVFTPIALGLKILGKDPLDRTLRRGHSYWIKRKPAPAPAQYYKQY